MYHSLTDGRGVGSPEKIGAGLEAALARVATV
jgi:hypothetical protein